MPLFIGISGGSGSGKSHVCKLLQNSFGEELIGILSQDNYYLPADLQLRDEKGFINFDLPTAIDHNEYVSDIKRLKQGLVIDKTLYQYNNPDSVHEQIQIIPKPVILLDGIFVLSNPEIKKEIDISVFVNSTRELMVARRVNRDAKERGYDKSDVLYRFEHHIWPSFERWVYPAGKEADFTVSNSSETRSPNINSVINLLKSRLNLSE